METFPSSWEDFSSGCKNVNLSMQPGPGEMVFASTESRDQALAWHARRHQQPYTTLNEPAQCHQSPGCMPLQPPDNLD